MLGKTETSPPIANHCFLNRCDPRSRMAAFIIASLIIARVGQATSTLWWYVALIVLFLPWIAGMSWRDFLLPLWRMRLFFLFLLLLHGFFVPGSALLPYTQWLSTEGLIVGAHQAIRLGLMACLAIVLVQVSSTDELIAGLSGLFGFLGKWGIPVLKWATLLSWTLTCVGRLLTLADATRDNPANNLEKPHWSQTITLLTQRASSFITDMMADMAFQERQLCKQGVLTGLPLPKPIAFHPGWRDIVLMAYPSCLLMVPWISTLVH
ncbi:MAG: hypothetical protein HQL74_02500 [Magnetococcales bacterium]|nr:hypothetical protein [Magnetococcales bacterium]